MSKFSTFIVIISITCLATGLMSCSIRGNAKQTLEQFLTAYKNEQWDICESLGTMKTKSSITILKKIRANFTEKELAVYNSQKLKRFQIQMWQEAGNQAKASVSINDGTQITVDLILDSDKWRINLEKPIP